MFLMAFPTHLLNRRSIGPDTRSSKPVKSLPDEQLHGDVVRLLLDIPLVTEACVPNRSGDVAHPAEPPHPFKGLAVGGARMSWR